MAVAVVVAYMCLVAKGLMGVLRGNVKAAHECARAKPVAGAWFSII